MRHTRRFVLWVFAVRINCREDLPCVGGTIPGGGVPDEVTIEKGERQLDSGCPSALVCLDSKRLSYVFLSALLCSQTRAAPNLPQESFIGRDLIAVTDITCI